MQIELLSQFLAFGMVTFLLELSTLPKNLWTIFERTCTAIVNLSALSPVQYQIVEHCLSQERRRYT